MLYRTELSIPLSPINLSHNSKSMTIGSCFSHHIGQRLQKYKFKCISNPFGTVFNPISISHLLSRAIDKQYIEDDELLMSQGVWVHPDFHFSLCHTDKQTTCQNINECIRSVHESIQEIDFLFVTLGTSIAYRIIENDRIVANCHKLPSGNFEKIETTSEDGFKAMKEAMEQLNKINPHVKIVMTISPVRHIRDGIIENSFSKARLHGMIEGLMAQNEMILYFPAYEWLMDDLRDYRYYDTDMIHPNEMAIAYIWHKFGEHFFDKDTSDLYKKIDAILKAVQHRPFNPTSEEHTAFKNHQLQAIQSLKKDHPYLDFEEEERFFKL